MPLFPNIGTLVTKATLNGQEVIQISATEKVTLQQIVDQLGFTLSGLLTGLTSASEGSFLYQLLLILYYKLCQRLF
jgi:hypothetical protein